MGDGSCNFPVQFVLNFHEGGGEGRVDTRYSTVKENQIEGVTSVEVIREPGGRPLVFAPQVQIPTQHAAGTAQAVHLRCIAHWHLTAVPIAVDGVVLMLMIRFVAGVQSAGCQCTATWHSLRWTRCCYRTHHMHLERVDNALPFTSAEL